MGFKKIALIAVLLIGPVMLFSSTYCVAKTLEEIKNDACPNKVEMKRIVKNNSRFIRMYPNETILLFPADPSFPDAEFQKKMEPNAINYARDSLRLIPPVARTKKFLRLYKEAILTVKGAHDKANESMVVQAFKAFESCMPPAKMMGKIVIPGSYADLKALISNPDNYEELKDDTHDLPEPPDPNEQ